MYLVGVLEFVELGMTCSRSASVSGVSGSRDSLLLPCLSLISDWPLLTLGCSAGVGWRWLAGERVGCTECSVYSRQQTLGLLG